VNGGEFSRLKEPALAANTKESSIKQLKEQGLWLYSLIPLFRLMELSDLKKIGLIIKLDNKPFQILEFSHERTAQRQATVKTKLKNLITGQVLEKTFSSSDKIEEAEIKKEKTSFLYQKGDEYYFLNQENFEQFPLKKEILKEKTNFLKEGLESVILFFENQPLDLELPKKVDLKVISAPPAVRGDSANVPTKIVTLETGLELKAPIFIKTGDLVRVNTETGEYVERVLK